MIFLKRHWIGIVLAILIGIVIAAPPFVWHFSEGYKGIDMMKTNTEFHYIAQIQEIYDGDHLARNPFFEDLKNTPYLFPPFSPNLIAGFGKLFSLNPVEAVMVTRFIFTTLLAFLIYLFAERLTKNRFVAWTAPAVIMLGYQMINPSHILKIFNFGKFSGEGTFIDYGRPINPQVGSLLFFAYLLAFWFFLQDSTRAWKKGIASAVLLGLSFYTYLFTWTFIFSLNGFLFLIYAWKKDWVRVKKIAWVSLGAVVLAIPYFMNTWIASHHPWYQESSVRFGFVHTRDWHVSQLIIGAFAVFLLLYKKLDEDIRLFFTAVFFASILAENENVITGLYVFNDHYHWYYVTPLILIIFLVMLFALMSQIKARPVVVYSIATALLVLSFYDGIRTQVISYAYAAPEVANEERYTPIIEWLNARTPKESTVFASYPLMRMIPALTHNNVYFDGTGIYTLVSDERLLHAYLVPVYLQGIPKENIEAYLKEHQATIVDSVFGYKFSFQKGVCASCAPDSVIHELAATYQELSDATIVPYLKQYPIAYIIWDKKEDPEWILDRLSLPIEAEFGDIVVYKVQ